MIDKVNINFSELCTLQFAEPLEYEMFDRQADYCGKICGKLAVQALISEDTYNTISGGESLDLICYDENDNELTSGAFSAYELSTGYYYIYAEILPAQISAFADKICYFKVYYGGLDETLAESLWYVLNPTYTGDIEEIEYTHLENDWNTVFVDEANELDFTFKVWVEGGFKPNDPRQEVETEDFVEQDMINETVYADEYEVLPFTLGDNSGVPVWLAKKFSRITKCDTVKYTRLPSGEQVEYKRTNGSKLEKTADFDERAGLANYKIDLQTTKNYLQ